MHDIASTLRPPFASGESEYENEFEGEFESEYENEFEGEFETGTFAEIQELELATQLLGVSNEQEMEQFLGNVFKSIGSAAKSFINSSAGKALGGVLKAAAKTALPIVGSALGNLVVPGVGGALGGQLAGMAGDALGLELEGLSNEDREFEVAQRLVRVGRQAAHNLARTPTHVPPAAAVRSAFVNAVRQAVPSAMRNPGLAQALRQAGSAVARAAVAPISARRPRLNGVLGNYNYNPTAPTPAPGYTVGTTPTYGTYGSSAPIQSGTAACTQCGAAQSYLPPRGTWRLSRSGRAIVLFVDGR